jgi:hypothetical protein
MRPPSPGIKNGFEVIIAGPSVACFNLLVHGGLAEKEVPGFILETTSVLEPP